MTYTAPPGATAAQVAAINSAQSTAETALTVASEAGNASIFTQQQIVTILSATSVTFNLLQTVNLTRITNSAHNTLQEIKFFGELQAGVNAAATSCYFTIALPFDDTEIDNVNKIAVTANYRNLSSSTATVIPVACYVETNGAQYKITFSINPTAGNENFILEFSAIAQPSN